MSRVPLNAIAAIVGAEARYQPGAAMTEVERLAEDLRALADAQPRIDRAAEAIDKASSPWDTQSAGDPAADIRELHEKLPSGLASLGAARSQAERAADDFNADPANSGFHAVAVDDNTLEMRPTTTHAVPFVDRAHLVDVLNPRPNRRKRREDAAKARRRK